MIAMRTVSAVLLTILMVGGSLSGCFGEDEEIIEDEPSPFDFGKDIPETTWYHYSGGIDARNTSAVEEANISANLTGENIPYWTQGSYYGIGMSTFEPTIGITSMDNIYMSSWGNGPSGSTAVIRCSGLIEMTALSEYSCENVYNPALPVPNSNDPYIYVDKWTDRIMKFDMHALLGMTVEFSDDEGNSWQNGQLASSIYSVQDHQTIGSALLPAPGYATTWSFCVNGNAPHPLCSTSFDGGRTWTSEVSGAPIDCQSGGLTAHIEGGVNGNLYRGNMGCNGDGYSIYRSTNGGLTWTEHPLPTEETGTADTWNGEEAQVAVDDDGNVHAMWNGLDNMPYYAYSQDEGETWSSAMMIAPPADLVGTGFPVVTAGAAGKVAFGYVGDSGNNTWNGYMTVITDAFNENPLMTTVQINEPGNPLDTEDGCGYNRCGGLGDFLDMSVDQYGRPWFGLSHNIADIGIFATISEGAALRGSDGNLSVIPPGGQETL